MVTIEATPSIAEKISVARALGDLSIALRPLADSASELDAAIADGRIKVPEGKDPKAEKAMLDAATNQPSAGKTTFATGADVSRFQRRTVPGKSASSDGSRTGGSSNGYPGAGTNMGPTVRIARGNSVTVIPVGGKN
jgi:pilus assembly protein CpaB